MRTTIIIRKISTMMKEMQNVVKIHRTWRGKSMIIKKYGKRRRRLSWKRRRIKLI
jgi:hypothetical protein